MRAYVDSDILIWHLRGQVKAAQVLRGLSAESGTELWSDAGRTFSAATRVSASSCGDSPNDAVALRGFPTYGDYFGLIAAPGGAFRLMWAEMRGNAPMLLTATVTVGG